MPMSDMSFHYCERSEGWMEYDARGIALTFVCDKCVTDKLKRYRPDVLTNPQYDVDEMIDPEPSYDSF